MPASGAAAVPPPYAGADHPTVMFGTGPTAHREPFGHAMIPVQTPNTSQPEAGGTVSGIDNQQNLAQHRLTPSNDVEARQDPEVSFRQQVKLEIDMLSASMSSTAETLAKIQQENLATRDLLQQLLNKADDNLLEQTSPQKADGNLLAQTPPQRTATDPWQQKTDPWQHRDDEEEKKLAEIDRKDVERPGKFGGDASKWRQWFMKFKGFLARRDPRWGTLLEAIKMNSQNPFTNELESEIFLKAGVKSETLKAQFKEHLYEYLETYTDGMTHSTITTAGVNGSLEVVRQLCDEGFSRRDRHLRKEYKRIMHPKQATFENLQKAILTWEAELAQYQLAADAKVEEKDKIMCLEDICPDALQIHLESKESLHTYADYKQAINDFLINRSRWTGSQRGRLNWMGLPSPGDDDEDLEPTVDADLDVDKFAGEIMALVKNKFKGKSKGPGKGGSRPPPKGDSGAQPGADKDVVMADAREDKKCYECGQPFSICKHLARDCPVRQQRVAAGAPARLPKGVGKGQGGG